MKQLVPLLTLALTAPSAMASSPNDIWSYQDTDGTTLAQACNNKSTCEPLYKNSHYIALVNNRSQTGCAIGDLLVAEHASRSFKKLDTGTCSTSASIEVNTYNRLNNIDVMVGDRLIKRYPLDAWKWEETRKEGKKPSWSKAEENAGTRKSYWNYERDYYRSADGFVYSYNLIGNTKTLHINCAYEFSGDLKHGKISLYHNGSLELKRVSVLNVDDKDISIKASNKAEWDTAINALFQASQITFKDDSEKVTIYVDKDMVKLPEKIKCDY